MPRTKISKKAISKRNRENPADEFREMKLREFDEMYEEMLNDFEMTFKQEAQALPQAMSMIRSQMSTKVLKMTVGEFKALGFKTVAEANAFMNSKGDSLIEAGNNTTADSASREISKPDEGYLTEDGDKVDNTKMIINLALSTTYVNCPNTSALPTPLGPLMSAKMRVQQKQRRSKSANSANIYQQQSLTANNQSVFGQKKIARNRTINPPISAMIGGANSQRMSRSRFRTPMGRIKAISVDRTFEPITPKVQGNEPVAFLRYPKAGETVISLKGSPVVASGYTEMTANVCIPVRNGVMSLRAAEMNDLNASLLDKIDDDTYAHLFQLRSNLDRLLNQI